MESVIKYPTDGDEIVIYPKDSKNLKCHIYPGTEVFFTECHICYHKILGGLEDIAEHTKSREHIENKHTLMSFLNINNIQGGSTEPELNDNNETKYFIESGKKSDEHVVQVLELPRGTPKHEGRVFHWCNLCKIRVPNDCTADEHLKSVLHTENSRDTLEVTVLPHHNSGEENEVEKSFTGIFLKLTWKVCAICDQRKLLDDDAVREHVKGWPHRYKLWSLSEAQLEALSVEHLPEKFESIPNSKQKLLCTVCKSKVKIKRLDGHTRKCHVQDMNVEVKLGEEKTTEETKKNLEEGKPEDLLKVSGGNDKVTDKRDKSPRQFPVRLSALPLGSKNSENTTAKRLISSFCLDNQKDSVSSPLSFKLNSNNIRRRSLSNVYCWDGGIRNGSSKEDKENEAEINAELKFGDERNYDKYIALSTSRKGVPIEIMLQYHYVGDTIDYIECKICDTKIRETPHTPATLEYLQHSNSEEHKYNENVFLDSWKSSASSYAAVAAAPPQSAENKREKKKAHKTIPCQVCGENFTKGSLHEHMTEHFWKRFLKPSLENLEESTDNTHEENVNGELKPVDLVTGEDESDGDSSHSLIANSPAKKVTSSAHFRTKPLDIELDSGPNIYEINDQRIKHIQLGVLLSFTIDIDNIYCLVCQKCIKNSLQNFYEHLSSLHHLKYLQNMINDHQKFKDFPDQFSDLALAEEYMEEVSEEEVKCHACGFSIPNNSCKLSNHINDPTHAKQWALLESNKKEVFHALHSRMQSNFYNVRRYWCVFCRTISIVEIEFREHLRDKGHLKKIKQYENETLIFDYCAICASLWYGVLHTFSYHSQCKMHKDAAYHNYYMVNKLPESAEKLLYAVEDNIEKILAEVNARRIDEKKKEDQVIRDLKKISKQRYPRVEAYPFGSRVNGLGGANSDLDIFLDCSTGKCPVYAGENSSDKQVLDRLVNIKKCLEGDPQTWFINRLVEDCRVPIITITHRFTGIECDISATNGLTVENTKIIGAYCNNYPNCRKLIIFLRNWMVYCELTGVNGINSYTIAWLVIYFLQVVSILPTIFELIDSNKASNIVAGWETGVLIDFEPRRTDQSFRELLTQFFKFYASFDYRNDVICPLLGEPVKKTLFSNPNELPSAMKPYLNSLNGENGVPFRVDSVLCLQDPFDLAHNLCKAVKKLTVYKLQTFCTLSAQTLDKNS
uniref:Tut1_2 protein n=1 Tax=Fopius arisanus TaxID=64838 RepID=A0A0C9RP81_9HYME